MVRIPRSHRGGRGSIPRLGIIFVLWFAIIVSVSFRICKTFPLLGDSYHILGTVAIKHFLLSSSHRLYVHLKHMIVGVTA